MKLLSDAELADIKSRVSLASVVMRSVKLTKAGKNLKGLCPFHAEKSPSFEVIDDHFHCFGCGAHGDVFDFIMKTQNKTFQEAAMVLGGSNVVPFDSRRPGPAPATKKPYRAPPPHKVTARSPELVRYFENRKISEETLEYFGVYSMVRGFGEKFGELLAMVFPVIWQGAVVNRYYRAISDKKATNQETDGLPALFNGEVIFGDSPVDEVAFVEGHIDCLSVYESEGPPCVSLPAGAQNFNWMETHAKELARVKKYYLAGDNDGPGKGAMDELARRLGRHKCWVVKWPEGCKDANDALRFHGPGTVYWAFKEAAPYPISGIRVIEPGRTLREWRNRPAMQLMTCGTPKLDRMLKLPTDGRLILVTGVPGHGKTAWTLFTAVHLMKAHNRRFGIFSPENSPWARLVEHCVKVLMNAPIDDGRFARGAGLEAAEVHEAWLADRLFALEVDGADERPTLDWILERAEMLIMRYGITDQVIDPWNELRHVRGKMERDEYIADCLARIKHWCSRYSVNVWVIAHPTKLYPVKPGQKPPMVQLYDVKGGSEWFDKCDIGICVHRPDDLPQVHLLKAKFFEYGKRNSFVELNFDPVTNRYFDVPDTALPAAPHWQDEVAD